MVCEGVTSSALIFILASGMSDYTAAPAAGDTLAVRAAEMRRYAYLCLCATTLAICHVLFLLLMPDATWARVELRAHQAVQSAARRLSTIMSFNVGSLVAAGGGSMVRVMLSQVTPEANPAVCVAMGAAGGRPHARLAMEETADEADQQDGLPAPRVRVQRNRTGGALHNLLMLQPRLLLLLLLLLLSWLDK